MPHSVLGWLSLDEGRALYELARGRNVLELGSFCGRSTICLAQSAAVVVAVDPHDGRATPVKADTHRHFMSNLAACGVSHKIAVVKGTRAEATELINSLAPFDLVFVDAAHDAWNVTADLTHAARLLSPDGVIAAHDYRLATEPGAMADPGVREAVDELLAGGWQLLARHDSLAVLKPVVGK